MTAYTSILWDDADRKQIITYGKLAGLTNEMMTIHHYYDHDTYSQLAWGRKKDSALIVLYNFEH